MSSIFRIVLLSSAGWASLVWGVFLATLVIAVTRGGAAPVEDYWTVSMVMYFGGLIVLPVLAIVSLFVVKRRRWMLPAVTALYLVTVLLLYPRVVAVYLAGHPHDEKWHWVRGEWCDYQYVAIQPRDGLTFEGQVSLFPPFFDIPKREGK